VLTHDVERRGGYERIDRVREVEAAYDLRSAWYLVPERDYVVGDAVLDRLRGAGCEIGLHGLRHDGRDLSPGEFTQRLTAMRAYAERWGVEGFRSPSTHRNAALIPQLGVRHDSSWSDVATYEPEPGGTCSWLPYFIGDVVELPITLPQDHTLFHIRNEQSDQVWVDKTRFLRGQRGMALMLTHPDYLDDGILGHYDRFLAVQANEPSVWHALPREVAAWWRRRSSSTPVRENGSWTVRGQAEGEARVHVGAPMPPPAAARARGAQVPGPRAR
jgi:peptidoglycan/xylan/chitin deacetylase (PgdA/CDA1 family)